MKKTLLLVLAIALVSAMLVLTGCGDSTPSDSNSIVGKWQYGTYESYVYTFNEDKTGSYAGRDFTYEVSGDHLSILYNGDTAPFETDYKIADGKLTIYDSLGSEVVYNRK